MILDTRILADYDMCMQTSKVYDCLPIIYPILGLNGEAGEAAEKVKKCLRDNNGDFDGTTRQAIKKELADVLWYIWAAADDMNTDLDEIMSIGIQKVKERQATNTIHGNGDDREIINNIEYTETKQKRYLKVNGEYTSIRNLIQQLRSSLDKTVNIQVITNTTIYEYSGKFVTIGRIDGGIIIELDDNLQINEIIEKMSNLNNILKINEYIVAKQTVSIVYTGQ